MVRRKWRGNCSVRCGDGRRLLYRVDVNNSDTGTLFIAGIPEFINVSVTQLVRTPEDPYRVFPVTGEQLRYEVSAHSGPPLPTPLADHERFRYLQLPPVDTRIYTTARAWGGAGSALDHALRIQAHLRRDFQYSLETANRPLPDPLANFLFVTKRGYCEYFASAMAVMLRTLGIPSRVVTGYQSGYYNEISGMYVIRASDAHAWVEAWIDGRGWVTFDPDAIRGQWTDFFDAGHGLTVAIEEATASMRGSGWGRGDDGRRASAPLSLRERVGAMVYWTDTATFRLMFDCKPPSPRPWLHGAPPLPEGEGSLLCAGSPLVTSVAIRVARICATGAIRRRSLEDV